MEWAPCAKSISIFGEFNNWNRGEFRCQRNDFGCFYVSIPPLPDGTPRIKHSTRYKIHIEGSDGSKMDRNSAWATMQIQQGNGQFDCMYWNPPPEAKHKWKHENVVDDDEEKSLRIYEAHVGMAQESGKVNTYREFIEHILPRIKKAGYNCI